MHKTLRCFGAPLVITGLGTLPGTMFGTTTATAKAWTVTDGSIRLIARDPVLDSFGSAPLWTLILES